ncbi:amylo-alpha-1,6-glucosidase [Bordetella genomosp. 9]|uniref:amylo-alpha-1,6-glucosidase n=1 Tax=Bordetella genomosp. 9 TaxID=1416803 RepID=UPI000A2918B6|nr:amylo-alpha-1,6-glucosidase [Bordetella genomosp. 9]ARP90133.1 amylo-alpha-1,6-glucosidase [Bordetella genomosp. 9]
MNTPTLAPGDTGATGSDIIEPRSPQRLFVLKEGDTFLVADAFGDVTGEGDGLFHDDTRLLSTFRLRLADRQPSLLSSAVSQDNAFFTANLTNRPLPPLGGASTPEGVIHVERRRFLWQGRLFERITLVNYGERVARVPLSLHYGADFRDMFEVRGQQRPRRGEFHVGHVGARDVELCYRGLDDRWRRLVIAFSEVPARISADQAHFDVTLGERQHWELYVEAGGDAAACGRTRWRAAAAQARRSLRVRRRRGAALHASSRLFQAWVDKSAADLALLTTELPTGPYPYAGIPWFSTPFGRDAIVTALQTLWLDPALARGVLAFLSRNQAHETSTFRDAEPGKIMHETRKGEMAAANELPFGRYYGGVDTTPLFIMLAGAYAERTGDLAFIGSIWPALLSAANWIEDNAARHGTGFLSYARGEESGLANQGWKDSQDSVFHADGSTPRGPIALIEVQGYAYAAYRGLAALARARGEEGRAQGWERRADALRQAVEQHFWQDDMQFYALALDGEGRPCRVRASNAGHLLYTGLPSPVRAQAVARQLLSKSFRTGWGIRTLAVEAPRYNPMSYHNGSVWPHDVALCAAGMARYGLRDGAAQLLDAMFEGASYFGMRLPELFCGFERGAGEAPIAYPVACLPQAWAAGSVFMLLQACLGLRVDGPRHRVIIEQPRLPHGMETLRIARLAVGGQLLDFTFQRLQDRVVAFVRQNGDAPRVRVDLRL